MVCDKGKQTSFGSCRDDDGQIDVCGMSNRQVFKCCTER